MRLTNFVILCGMLICALDVVSGKMMGMMTRKKNGKRGMSTRMMCMMKYNDLADNVQQLKTRVDESLSNPVHVHVHGYHAPHDEDESGESGEQEVMLERQEMEHEHAHSHGSEVQHIHPHKPEDHHSSEIHDSHIMHAKSKHQHRKKGRKDKSKYEIDLMSSDEEEDDSDSSKDSDASEDSDSSEDSEDSGSSEGSSEEHGWRGKKKGGTHVHIHLNVGAEVAELLSVHRGGGSKEEHEHTHTHKHKHENNDTEHEHEHEELAEYPDEYVFAKCDVVRNSASITTHNVRGNVFLRQKPKQPLEIKLDLYGFDVRQIRNDLDDPRHLHGFHVHQFGDFSNGCNSFGGHYNPEGHAHGGPGQGERHVGDWGNIECDHRGVVRTTFNESMSTLYGRKSIIGRGLVIHERADDHGLGDNPASKASGDAGGRIACCVISWAKGMW